MDRRGNGFHRPIAVKKTPVNAGEGARAEDRTQGGSRLLRDVTARGKGRNHRVGRDKSIKE